LRERVRRRFRIDFLPRAQPPAPHRADNRSASIASLSHQKLRIEPLVTLQTARNINMSKKAADHHKKAAEHHGHAAKHHTEAAKHHESGNHEKAAHHAHSSRAHAAHADEHAESAAKAHLEEHDRN
jgi:hypothetical protein